MADRYQVALPLGAGGMGEVYEARDEGTGEAVALKIILSERFAKDPGSIKRFEREGRMMGTLATPHIVRFLAAGRDGATGTPFLAMELLQGEDLKQLFRRVGPLHPSVALRIAAQLCLGLKAAHEVGLVHRDVKPANVFATRTTSGEIVVKLLDFGVAKMDVGDAASLSLSASGGMIGSPAYMSPEQALGHEDIDARTDICSVGVLLYEALAGTTPFGERTSLGQVIVAICSEPPPRIEEIAPWVPSAVADLVHRAMAKRREARFQSAGELLEGILAILATMNLPAPPEGAIAPRAYLHASSVVGIEPHERARRAHPIDTRPAFAGARSEDELEHTATDPRRRPLVVRSRTRVQRRTAAFAALALSLGLGGFVTHRLTKHDVATLDPSATRAPTTIVAGPVPEATRLTPAPAVDSIPVPTAASSESAGASALPVKVIPASARSGKPRGAQKSVRKVRPTPANDELYAP